MTRILLPAQIFLFAGSVIGATLLVRKQFLYQALQPIVYNVCIIAGGVFLGYLGVTGLAIGATVGFLLGAFALNAWGAARNGVRYRSGIDLHHPGLRLWLQMTLPLMFGFGLPFLDQYFSSYYASGTTGDITRLANAKQLFSAPMSMLAQAAGVASLPFFSQLWAKGQRYEFAIGVADSVSRVIALGLLAASAMIALAEPIVGLVFGGGRFTPADVRLTALFFPSTRFPCSCGRRRPSMRALFTPPESPGCPCWPAPSSCWSPSRFTAWATPGGHRRPGAWPPTPASLSRPSPSPCCCTSAAWSPWPAWTLPRWAAA
jgi:putative peptidoglycan lipid II flippase